MAKQVTQDTFDDVVKENVQEFEMSVEEAINDAVQQFESQVGIIITLDQTSLTLSQTTNFRFFQTERVCRGQFQI